MSRCDELLNYVRYDDVVYRLLGYLVSDIDDAQYPSFEIFLKEDILFKSLSEAEAKVHELANLDEYIVSRAYFFIHEVPLGITCYHSYGQRIRSYTSDGKFYAETKASLVEDINGNLEPFYGRDKDECHFQPGDIVEVVRGDVVTLEIIVSLPIDRETLEKKSLASGRKIQLDFTDDGYTTLNGDEGYMQCHSHPSIVQCFPPNTLMRIPEDIIHTLKRAYARYSTQI